MNNSLYTSQVPCVVAYSHIYCAPHFALLCSQALPYYIWRHKCLVITVTCVRWCHLDSMSLSADNLPCSQCLFISCHWQLVSRHETPWPLQPHKLDAATTAAATALETHRTGNYSYDYFCQYYFQYCIYYLNIQYTAETTLLSSKNGTFNIPMRHNICLLLFYAVYNKVRKYYKNLSSTLQLLIAHLVILW
jgi:hypothetical protein